MMVRVFSLNHINSSSQSPPYLKRTYQSLQANTQSIPSKLKFSVPHHPAEMAEQFVGKWKLVDSENFEAYMKQVGVGLIKRKLGAAVKPVLTFTVDGNHWKMVSDSTFTNWVCEFDLGEEIEQDTPDGRQMKSTFTFENGKLIEKQKKVNADDKNSRIERFIDSKGQLIINCESEGVKAVRTYQRET